MRNMKIVDAVIQLHDIARLVEQEIGKGALSDRIRLVADDLHVFTIHADHADQAAKDFLDKNLG